MPADAGANGDSYGRVVGLVYIFNLIVGTGALTMPFAFSQAGWLLSIVGVSVLCFMSYLTATFMVEAMAAANAIFRFKTLKHYKRVSNQHDTSTAAVEAENDLVDQMRNDQALAPNIDHDERVVVPDDQKLVKDAEDDRSNGKAADNSVTYSRKNHGMIQFSRDDPGTVESVAESSSVDYFEMTERFEMGKMAGMFYNTWGIRLFYCCIAIYLYGDLAIYAAAVAKSLRDVACERIDTNLTKAEQNAAPCWSGKAISRIDMYRVFLACFVAAVGPFTFFNVQKTKYLQIFTTILRWKAFIAMIILCLIAIIGGQAKGHPKTADFLETPALFGVCVYSFMCHHSLPSLITPIQPKKRVFMLMLGDFVLILVFYNLLSLTGVFTFTELKDMYTLNFEPSKDPSVVPEVPYLQYFLLLFPVLTLSSNFPIIAITLTNNLRTLAVKETSPWWLKQVFIPVMALIPPSVIALLVADIDLLVSFTGAYAGAMIQYVIPATLVYLARREVNAQLGPGIRNTFASPFQWRYWIHFVMGWTACCIVLVTAHIIRKWTK